jgi:hypothetical protein
MGYRTYGNNGSRIKRRSNSSGSTRQERRQSPGARSAFGRFCSLIPGLGVKLSAIIPARPSVLSAVGTCPPHDGVRRRWSINIAGAVSSIESSQKIGRPHHRHRPGWDVFSPPLREPRIYIRYAAASLFDQVNSVLSTHMRCRMTASLRATATLALRSPFRLASLMPQAFSADHLGTRVSNTSRFGRGSGQRRPDRAYRRQHRRGNRYPAARHKRWIAVWCASASKNGSLPRAWRTIMCGCTIRCSRGRMRS